MNDTSLPQRGVIKTSSFGIRVFVMILISTDDLRKQNKKKFAVKHAEYICMQCVEGMRR